MLDNTQDGLIFVWGNFGKKLSDLDAERLFAIAQKNADKFLSILYLKDIDDINLIDKVIDESENGLTIETKKLIMELNKKDTIFREIHKFFQINQDNLSVGSLLTGNIDKSGRFASILETKNKDMESD